MVVSRGDCAGPARGREAADSCTPTRYPGWRGRRNPLAEQTVSLILSWVLFPLVLAAIGAGWGAIVERAAGDPGRRRPARAARAGGRARRSPGTLTAFPRSAPAAVTVVAVGAVAGLVFAWPGRRLRRGRCSPRWASCWPMARPCCSPGRRRSWAVVKLDDTSTWFNIIDNVISHGRSVAGLPPSTYSLNFGQANPAYPLGAFMLPGVARALIGVDIAWVFQPYLACCGGGGGAVPVCAHAAAGRLAADAGAAGVRGRPVRAALRLQPVGRDQGTDRRVPAGAGGGARRGRALATLRRAGASCSRSRSPPGR